MGDRTQNIMLAAVVVVLCVMAALIGYMFVVLTDDDDDRGYALGSTCIVDGEEHPVSGSVSFEEYEESGNSRVYAFSIDAVWLDSAGAGHPVSGKATSSSTAIRTSPRRADPCVPARWRGESEVERSILRVQSLGGDGDRDLDLLLRGVGLGPTGRMSPRIAEGPLSTGCICLFRIRTDGISYHTRLIKTS